MFGMGWIPDLPDHRDWKLPKAAVPRVLPDTADLTPQTPGIYDQSSIGSCAPHGYTVVYRFVDQKQGGSNVLPSRLFWYYEARRMRGWQNTDSGCYIRDVAKVGADLGAAPEDKWPYDVSRFCDQPPKELYPIALERQVLGYFRVEQSVDAYRECLADGFPFIIGATLYENFLETGKDGIVSMPSGKMIGGHAFAVMGYRDATRRFICQNSWGKDWGAGGFFTMPYDYLTDEDLAADSWTIRSVEETDVKPEPDPGDLPVIESVHYNGTKLKVHGTKFHAEAALLVDGLATQVFPRSTELIKCRIALAAGSHWAVVKNPNATSMSYTFKV